MERTGLGATSGGGISPGSAATKVQLSRLPRHSPSVSGLRFQGIAVEVFIGVNVRFRWVDRPNRLHFSWNASLETRGFNSIFMERAVAGTGFGSWIAMNARNLFDL